MSVEAVVEAESTQGKVAMSEDWYHLVKYAADEDAATLWKVSRDDAGYTCRVWQLSAFDGRKVEAWMRMMESRKAAGLSEPPLPDIADKTPVETRFGKIHEARAYLGTTWDPKLKGHAAEFFRQIDPVRYPPP